MSFTYDSFFLVCRPHLSENLLNYATLSTTRWKGGREVECAGLEIRYTVIPYQGHLFSPSTCCMLVAMYRIGARLPGVSTTTTTRAAATTPPSLRSITMATIRGIAPSMNRTKGRTIITTLPNLTTTPGTTTVTGSRTKDTAPAR